MRDVCLVGLAIIGAAALVAPPLAWAQQPPAPQGPRVQGPPAPGAGRFGGRGQRGPPPDARAAAPIDLTGYWVALVTEDWRFRMVIPAKGDYDGVPLNLAAKQFADRWNAAPDEAAGKQCEAYGAGAIMLVPARLHILWQDGNTLLVNTDAGMQTRVLHFQPAPSAAAAPPSWQGYSLARWDLHPGGGGFGGGGGVVDVVRPPPAPPRGSLEIHTRDLLPGLLRKNGVPYGGDAQLTEYWEVNQDGGERWLTVTSQLTDSQYLEAPYITNAIFQKQADSSGWDPTQCSLQH